MSVATSPLEPPCAVLDALSFQAATGATDAQMADLERYLALLTDWNGRMNLVGPSALAQFWPRHAFDSAQLLQWAPDAKVWADLGTGAGLPGIILAIFLRGRGGAKVHLVESMAKRCRFLSAVVEALDLPAAVLNTRAEAGGPAVEIVTARALAPLPRLLEYGWPYLRKGARGLFLKGQDVESELTQATICWKFNVDLRPSLSDPGGRIVDIREVARVA